MHKRIVENAMRIELDDRLKMLTDLVNVCDVAADVGTDHGFLGAWLLENKRCRKMQFLDISAPSLNKARNLIEDMQLEEKSIFSVGDGLDALTEDAQTVIIAGMGGLTIAGIVERGRERLKGARSGTADRTDAASKQAAPPEGICSIPHQCNPKGIRRCGERKQGRNDPSAGI